MSSNTKTANIRTVQTYWLTQKKGHDYGYETSQSGVSTENGDDEDDELERRVDWTVEVFANLLRKVVASRPATGDFPEYFSEPIALDSTPLDEVKEIIELPEYSKIESRDPSTVVLPLRTLQQLRRYVSAISDLYIENPFHNFEHACHV